MADVHRLTPAGPITGPQQDVIDELEQLLESARRGEIKGFGFFVVDGADGNETGWAPGCARQNDMVAGACLLYSRVMSARRAGEGTRNEPRDPA